MHTLKNTIAAGALATLLVAGLTGCFSTTSGGSSTSGTGTGTTGSTSSTVDYSDAHYIVLSDTTATLDGVALEEFDYTWHCDPSVSHDEVKNAPAEYYTGTEPQTDAAAYIDHELYYFPELDESGFTLVTYDGEREWAYYYTDGEHDEYIFATLPNLGNSLPTAMMHSEEEAAQNKVLHITQPGTYVLSGTWKGQIWIDLGDTDDTFTDETAKVTLVLASVDIECTVAPGVVFRSAYECDNTWEDQESWSADVDTSDAGVTVVLADDTQNTVTGTNVYRMLKTTYKSSDSTTNGVALQKKMRKIDAAFYSYVTMNIEGGGSLTVNSGFEGLDTELHLTINGGTITINSQDDGINVNEDNVSVVCFNGGNVTINAAQGAEGDGVDSNGYIVVNGGTINVNNIRVPDNALDSEDGVYYNGGTINVDGEEQTLTPGTVTHEVGGMSFGGGFGGGSFPGGQGGPGDMGGFGGQGGNPPSDMGPGGNVPGGSFGGNPPSDMGPGSQGDFGGRTA